MRAGGRNRAGRLAGALAVLLCVAGLAACAGSKRPPPERGETVHVLKPGETVYRLSRHYGVSVDDIVRANGIRDVSDLSVGMRIRIPSARRGPPDGSIALAAVAPGPGSDLRALALRESNLDFAWPLEGRLSSGFGHRGRRPHHGIDISARPGTPIRAAESGKVIYSGWLGGYGRIVIVKHAGRYSTVYAHNRANRVRVGQFVERGDVVATVGSSGRSSGPHVHFEVRRDDRAQNPLRYLP